MKKYGEGIIRFKGSLRGRHGIYYGVEARMGSGKHNGTYDGYQYFECPHGAGIFVQRKHVIGFAKKQDWAKKVAALNQTICKLKTENNALQNKLDAMGMLTLQIGRKENEVMMLTTSASLFCHVFICRLIC